MSRVDHSRTRSFRVLLLMQIIVRPPLWRAYPLLRGLLIKKFMDPSTGNTTVFVVDDDESVRDSIVVLLQVHGFEVEAFASVAEFVSGYRKPRRGCVVLDHCMPGTTGLDFLESEEGRKLEIPVILITGVPHLGLERRAQGAGATSFLRKPVGTKLLIERIKIAVERL